MIEQVHSFSVLFRQFVGFIVPLFSLLSNLSLGSGFVFRFLSLWGQRVSRVGTFIVIIALNHGGFIEGSSVHSNLKLYIVEMFGFSRSDVFVVDWVAIFEASTGVIPTVGVSVIVVMVVDEDAH